MQEDKDGVAEDRVLVTNRPMDVLVALAFLVASAIVIYDSTRIGLGWIEGQGPSPGYFPFYVAVIMGAASVVNLLRALARREDGGSEAFVTLAALPRVLAVLIPTIGYVALVDYVGIYVASAILIAGFMLVFGRENPLKSLAVGTAVPVALFFMFEKWFLVPLPKGPVEAMLGL